LKDVAAQLRGFGPVGLLALFIILAGNLLVVPLSAVLVLVWAQLSQTPLQTLGFTAPRRWTRTLAIGIPFGVALKLVMKAIVMPLFGAGFGEETVFRGFFFERLGKLLGTRPAALAATVVLTSGLFALAHYWDQGLPGVQQAALAGFVFGTIFAVTGQIWLQMVAHAAFDVTAVALTYWGWESVVAHFLFR